MTNLRDNIDISMDIPLCRLCRTNPAVQKNSHIFPKFLKKEYLKTDKRFFLVNSTIDNKMLQQDLPKEDNILCPICESRLQTIESNISLHLNNSYNIFKRIDYPIHKLLEYEYQYFNSCDPKIFTLFVYSLIWRAHISSLPLFKDFILPENCAEDLRKTLNITLPEKISELSESLSSLTIQRWHYIFIKPQKREKMNHPIIYNDNIINKKMAYVFIFEYAIIFLVNRKTIPEKLQHYANHKFKKVRLMILGNDLWNYNSLYAAKSIFKIK